MLFGEARLYLGKKIFGIPKNMHFRTLMVVSIICKAIRWCGKPLSSPHSNSKQN